MAFQKNGLFIFLLAFALSLNQIVHGKLFMYKNTSRDVLLEELFSSDSDLIANEGVWAYIQVTEPEHACSAVQSVPVVNIEDQVKWFAIVGQSDDPSEVDCATEVRVENLKKAGFSGLINYWESTILKKGQKKRLLQSIQADEKVEEAKSTGDFPIITVLPDDGSRIKYSYTYEHGVLAFIAAESYQTTTDGPLYERHTFTSRPIVVQFIVIFFSILLVVFIGFLCWKKMKN